MVISDHLSTREGRAPSRPLEFGHL